MIRIYPSTFSGKISAPASKAHAQRLLFMSSMPAFPTTVKNVPDCDDIDTCLDTLRSLGCEINPGRESGDIVVKPFPKTSPLPSAELNFRESSTTARFAVALCSALGIKADCRAGGNLPKRKMIQLTGRLAIRGVTFSSFSLPFSLNGRLEAGDFCFAGDEGSQSISALMMFLPCILGDSTITFESPLTDRSFIDLTKNSLEKFKIRIEEKPNGFFIPGKQFYQSPKNISTENDWSLASMWLTAGAACGNRSKGLTIDNLSKKSPQQYRNLMPILSLISQNFMDINIDASTMPNLATLFCALAIVKGATVRITGVPQLKYKESNRLKTMSDIAKALGQYALVTDDGITIMGNGKCSYKENTVVDCQKDPWVFMSMALASSVMDRPLVLSDEHDADKIYRNFLKDFEILGGKFEII